MTLESSMNSRHWRFARSSNGEMNRLVSPSVDRVGVGVYTMALHVATLFIILILSTLSNYALTALRACSILFRFIH
jgi:NADH:ubiquinone oxidoreductase subunit 2 (subunit N)